MSSLRNYACNAGEFVERSRVAVAVPSSGQFSLHDNRMLISVPPNVFEC